MTRGCRLVEVDPTVDPRWDRLMRGSRGSLFGSPPWLRAIASTYAMTFRARLLVDDDGDAVAGMVFSELDDVRGRRYGVPFVDRLDPIVRDVEDWRELTAPLFVDAPSEVEVSFRVLDAPVVLEDDRLYVHHELAFHETDLARSESDVLGGFDGGVRRNLRHAARSGVVVEVGSSLDEVREMHRLHRHTRRYKYGLLAQPAAFFDNIWNEFDAVDVALARIDGSCIAGALCIEWNGVQYYKFGASIADALHVRPNESVHWALLRRGIERGCHTFDWGVSDLDQPGLVRYKSKFATAERRVAVLRRVGYEADARAQEAGRLLGSLTALLTAPDVPDAVSARAGDLLYRYFA